MPHPAVFPDVSAVDGIHVSLVTPFTHHGAVDTASLERLARHCLEGGGAGLVALGTTGEPAMLTSEEQGTVLRVCRKVSDEYGVPGRRCARQAASRSPAP